MNVSVDVRALACEDVDNLRAHTPAAVRELPEREVAVEEASN